MHIYYIEIICDDVFGTNIVSHSAYIFAKVLFTAIILPNIFHTLTRIFFWIISGNILVGSLAKSCLLSAPSTGSVKG